MNSQPVSTTNQLPRRADNSVDWRAVAMQVPEHFYVKRDAEEKVAKLLSRPVTEIANLGPEDILKVPDKYLVIRKAGVLRLARLRGYTGYTPEVKFVQRDHTRYVPDDRMNSHDYVVVQMWVDWAPFEGEAAKRTGAVGEANPQNTSKIGYQYPAAVATNRAFALATRNFLEIDIVSSDELGEGIEPEHNPSTTNTVDNSPSPLTPQGTLAKAAQEHVPALTFEQVKKGAQVRWDEDTKALAANPAFKRRIENDPSVWNAFVDVPPRDCYTLTGLIRSAKGAREANQAEKVAAQAVNAAVNAQVEAPEPAPAPTQAPAPEPQEAPATTSATSATSKRRTRATKVTPISDATAEAPTQAAA